MSLILLPVSPSVQVNLGGLLTEMQRFLELVLIEGNVTVTVFYNSWSRVLVLLILNVITAANCKDRSRSLACSFLGEPTASIRPSSHCSDTIPELSRHGTEKR